MKNKIILNFIIILLLSSCDFFGPEVKQDKQQAEENESVYGAAVSYEQLQGNWKSTYGSHLQISNEYVSDLGVYTNSRTGYKVIETNVDEYELVLEVIWRSNSSSYQIGEYTKLFFKDYSEANLGQIVNLATDYPGSNDLNWVHQRGAIDLFSWGDAFTNYNP